MYQAWTENERGKTLVTQGTYYECMLALAELFLTNLPEHCIPVWSYIRRAGGN